MKSKQYSWKNGKGTGRRWMAGISFIALAVLGTGLSFGCPACNNAFGKEMEAGKRNPLLTRDFENAVRNQAGIKLEGLGSGAFKPQLHEDAVANDNAEPVKDVIKAEGDATETLTQAAINSAAAVPPAAQVTSQSFNTRGLEVLNPATRMAVPKEWESDPFIEVIRRDYEASVPPTSYVPQDTKPDHSFKFELHEGKAYIGNGVIYDGFLTDGTVPGPLFIVEEGDIVEMEIVNKGAIPHGASIHSAYTQTSKYLGYINPGSSGKVVFRANTPGVYMYHCAPGGHAIPMHVLFGQYGMMVVKPKSHTYKMEEVLGKKPDIEIYMIQHEFYASGKDAVNGHALYTTFNGKLFRYVEEPIKARPGDFVRIYFLNVGPNLISTFHIVGIIWDYIYWQGNPLVAMPGGQTVTAGPSDSFVIDFRIPPDEGAYTMLNHAVGSASRGAIGLIVAEKDAEIEPVIRPEGVFNTQEEMEEMAKEAVRTISPFKPTDYDRPVRMTPAEGEVAEIKIIGNSFDPKVIEIEAGTTVRWINEDVFTYLSGEFAGVHNAQGSNSTPPEGEEEEAFATALLAHGEHEDYTFTQVGEYNYICLPHPYMEGKIIVREKGSLAPAIGSGGGGGGGAGWLIPLALAAFFISLVSIFVSRNTSANN